MAVNYTQFYDQMRSLVDSINHDSDPGQRLTNLQRLYKDGVTMLLLSRDQAAYDLRVKYSSEDAETVSRISRKYIDYWARRWMRRNGLPSLKQKRRVDLSNVLDLSGRLRQASPSDPNLPPRTPERQD